MGIRAPLIMSLLIIAAMLAVTVWVWPHVANDTPLAVHWGLDNQPNGFASKGFALLLLPGMAGALTVLFAFLLPPLMGRETFAQNAAAYEVGWVGAVALLAVCHVMIVMAARGYRPDVAGNATFAVGLLLTVVGNFLGRTRPNPFVGIRTYWTLRSDYSWEKSNRALGRMFVATGLVTLASLAVAGRLIAMIVLLVGALGSAVASIALSYMYWKNDPERAAHP
ncbi:MAG: SdpI family protein [Rhizomicrobium sp.]|jgi:uncharacterized membrane protein